MTLFSALKESRVIVTCGAGGIGKTTTAAALGLGLARAQGARVLVLTIDPARRLADALGLSGIGNDVSVVSDHGGEGELSVAMLDTRASWDALIHRHAPDEQTAQRILNNVLYQNITGRFIQSHDYIAMERLYELVSLEVYDVIVVDTPPSRNALDFLDAPKRMADFFSSRLLRWLTAPARGGLRSLASKPFTQITDRILGSQFIGDISEFFVLLESMYPGFIERARKVETLLADESTSFLVVSTLESAPLKEAQFFVDELLRRHLHVTAWLLNRVLSTSLRSSRLGSALDDLTLANFSGNSELAGATAPVLASVRDQLVDNARHWSAVADHEERQMATLRTRGVPLVSIPALDGEISDLAGLEHLGDLVLNEPFVLEFGDERETT